MTFEELMKLPAADLLQWVNNATSEEIKAMNGTLIEYARQAGMEVSTLEDGSEVVLMQQSLPSASLALLKPDVLERFPIIKLNARNP